MGLYLGIDTSNYTTSAALYDSGTGEIRQEKRLLPVAEGALGLRQSDAVFLHVRQLGPLVEAVLEGAGPLAGVGYSKTPRDEAGSYMPCFLTGELAATAAAASCNVPLRAFSHQGGHVMAALYATDNLHLVREPFLAFHISGGTTQCLLVEPDREKVFSIQTLAETLDLNAGQIVDRVGTMLGLGFPAGPALEALASGSSREYAVKPTMKGRDCCLSGLENQCKNMIGRGEAPADVAKYCLCYLSATLLAMVERVREVYQHPMVFAGGVMSNQLIRGAIERRYQAHFAPPAFSADNAAGVAVLCAQASTDREGGEAACSQ